MTSPVLPSYKLSPNLRHFTLAWNSQPPTQEQMAEQKSEVDAIKVIRRVPPLVIHFLFGKESLVKIVEGTIFVGGGRLCKH